MTQIGAVGTFVTFYVLGSGNVNPRVPLTITGRRYPPSSCINDDNGTSIPEVRTSLQK